MQPLMDMHDDYSTCILRGHCDTTVKVYLMEAHDMVLVYYFVS